MYGAYNEANAKLVTAEGNYPSNYEHYSGFEPRKKKTGILKGTIEFSLLIEMWRRSTPSLAEALFKPVKQIYISMLR